MAFQTLEGFAAPLDVIMFKTCVSFSKKRGLWKIILEIMYFCGNKKKSAAFSQSTIISLQTFTLRIAHKIARLMQEASIFE